MLTANVKPDVLVFGQGRSYLFDPVSDEAKDWAEDHLHARRKWGGAVVVDEPEIVNIINDARHDGLVVE